MPHTTPARELIRASRRAAREIPQLRADKKADGTTAKQVRFAKHMKLVAIEHVIEAMRAYVNDMFVDDHMHRRDLVRDPHAYKHISSIVTRPKGPAHVSHAYGARVNDPDTLVAAFVAKGAGIPAHARWFNEKTQGMIGMSLLQGKKGLFRFGVDERTRDVTGTIVDNVHAIDLNPRSLDLGDGHYVQEGGRMFLGAEQYRHNNQLYSLATFSTAVHTEDSAAWLYKRVLEHGDDYDRGSIYQLYVANLRVSGLPNDPFRVPRCAIDQELDCEGFLRAVFHRESVFESLPEAYKKMIFYWTILRRAELYLKTIYTAPHGLNKYSEVYKRTQAELRRLFPFQ